MRRTNTKSVGRTVTTMTNIALNVLTTKYAAEVIQMTPKEVLMVEGAIDHMKDKIISRIEQTRDKDKNAGEYPYNRCIEIVKEVFGDDSKRID